MTSHIDTRTRLLNAAERLFATEGIDRAQIQAITRLAGQRNTSALHYHFGSRTGLLHAVLRRHLDEIESSRSKEVETLATTERTGDLQALVRALVFPAGAKLSSEEGRNYLQILDQYLSSHGHRPLSAETPSSLAQLLGWLRAALKDLPATIAEERIDFVLSAMTGALAKRAIAIQSRKNLELTDDQFLENLSAMLHGALAADLT